MFRLAALNEQHSDTTTNEVQKTRGTKEAQEARAFELYNDALQLQRVQRHDDAIKVYEDLLKTSLVTDAATTLIDEYGEAKERPLKDPGLILKYSTHKNMASMSADRDDINTAMEHYLQAVMLDTTDVTLWQRIGTHAITLGRLPLARHAFTSGLACNEDHWPCLDSAITVLYALLDYESCLYWIAKGLQRDPEYVKGIVLREKMFGECPHLRRDTESLFRQCSYSIYDTVIDDEEAREIIREAIELRARHQQLCLPTPPREYDISSSLKKLSWLSLGESLITAYDHITTSKDVSFISPIRFENIEHLKAHESNKSEFETKIAVDEENMEVDVVTVDDVIASDDMPVTSSAAAPDSVKLLLEEDSRISAISADSRTLASADVMVHDYDGDVINDVMESLLTKVCAADDKSVQCIARNNFDDVFSSTSDVISDDVIIAELLTELLDIIESQNILLTSNMDNGKEDVEPVSEQEKVKKNVKRKKLFYDSITEEHMKRRSSRVRTSSKKRQHQATLPQPQAQTDVNHKNKILRLLPDRFKELPKLATDAEEQVVEVSSSPERKIPISYKDEETGVLSFMEENDGEFIVDLMQNYCKFLAGMTDILWEAGTSEIIAKVFSRWHSHVTLPHFDDVTDKEIIRDQLFTILCCIECCIDCAKKSKSFKGCTLHDLESYMETLSSAANYDFFNVKNLQSQIRDNASLNRDWKSFAVRFLWARSKFNDNFQRTHASLTDVITCKDILHQVRTNAFSEEPYLVEPAHGYVINLPNHKNYPLISLAAIEKKLNHLERTQVLEDTNKYFEQESYRKLIALLKPTIQKKLNFKLSTNQNRARQIRQLLVSYQQLRDNEGIITSSCYLVHEVVANATEASRSKKKKSEEEVSGKSKQVYDVLKQWNATLHVTLQVLDRTLIEDEDVLRHLCEEDKIILIHGVIEIIRYVLIRIDDGHSFADAALMWIILYKILKQEEKEVDLGSCHGMPPSYQILDLAHNWMGGRGLCCPSDGALLRFSVAEIKKRFSCINRPDLKEEISISLEQCFYCMFAYPIKSKSRKLQEHGAKQLPLTWSDGVLLISHFQPEVLPEFDSFKTSTVSLELSQLLLRVIHTAPNNVLVLIPNSESDLISFIESGCADVDNLHPPPDDPDLLTLGNTYYLLADYYFKNNEMNKAVKYYLLHVRINPERFNSWAGMALARSSQTDDRLRLCESKKSQHKMKDSGTERRGLAALACFKRALSFDYTSEKLWIEYASLAYWLHSMYSRKLKRKKSLSSEEHQKKKEMLTLSRHCFERVMECEGDDVVEEEWFIHYMLGKLSEKEKKPVQVYLKLYQSAAMLLHYKHAKYPKKILAKYGADNDLAIEALEIHFRIHATILKYVLTHPDLSTECVDYMKDLVEEMANSPFALRHELKPTMTSQDSDKANISSKLTVTSQSSDLTMGSLLPDSVLQALNIEEAKTDEDTQSSTHSPMPPSDEHTQDILDTSVQCSVSATASAVATLSNDKEGDINPDSESIRQTTKERHKEDCDEIIDACQNALRLCVRRFPQHYKAIYRLAHLYAKHAGRKHLTWSRDLLYGSLLPWQQLRHMPAPGLLADKNKTNLFNGVWRIPMDDIDRPGSFAAHLYRCVALLLDVLRDLRHNETLLHIHNLLNRTPEHGRKYLREEDRIRLSRRAVVFARAVLNRKIKAICNTETIASAKEDISAAKENYTLHAASSNLKKTELNKDKIIMSTSEECMNLLMDAYKVYQDTQKHPDATAKVDNDAEVDDISHQHLLANAYHKYTCIVTNSNSSPPSSPNYQTVFEEALRFCQQQNICKKTIMTSSSAKSSTSSSSMTSSSKQPINTFKPVENSQNSQPEDETHATADNVKDLHIHDVHEPDLVNNGVDDAKEKPEPAASDSPPLGKVTMVQNEGKVYTLIRPPPSLANPRPFAPSPDSAFSSTGLKSAVAEKRRRLDPRVSQLKIQSAKEQGKKLLRSTSVPVTYPEGEENTPPRHRQLYRTGSFVSDSTKLKLKSAILARTSAAVVRKPSITDQEMKEITDDGDADSDSSQSDDEEYMLEEGGNERKRKFLDDNAPTVSSSEQQQTFIPSPPPTAITTVGST